MKSIPKVGHSIQLLLLLFLVAELTFCVVLLLGASGCSLGDLDLHAKDLSIGDKSNGREAVVPIVEKAVLP